LGVWAWASPDWYLLRPPAELPRQEFDLPGLQNVEARQAEREVFRQRARDWEAFLGTVGCGLGLLVLGTGVWLLRREYWSSAEPSAPEDGGRDPGSS
jgi:hypothetical protein